LANIFRGNLPERMTSLPASPPGDPDLPPFGTLFEVFPVEYIPSFSQQLVIEWLRIMVVEDGQAFPSRQLIEAGKDGRMLLPGFQQGGIECVFLYCRHNHFF